MYDWKVVKQNREKAKEKLATQIEKNQHITIECTKEDFDLIKEYCNKLAWEKSKEKLYWGDGADVYERNVSGKMAEVAVGKWLGQEIVDLSIGESKDYSLPDLLPAGYEVGIKCCRVTSGVPYVPTYPKCPEIICAYDEKQDKLYIMGLATVEVMKKYGNAKLNGSTVNPNYKKGFDAFDKLIPLTPELLQKYKVQKSLDDVIKDAKGKSHKPDDPSPASPTKSR